MCAFVDVCVLREEMTKQANRLAKAEALNLRCEQGDPLTRSLCNGCRLQMSSFKSQ